MMANVYESQCAHTGRKLTLSLGDISGDPYRAQFCREFHCPRELQFLTRNKTGINQFIDIGANIGHFTISAGLLGIRTLAVEALADNFVLLCQSLHANGLHTVLPFCAAASDKFGTVAMRLHTAYAQVDETAKGETPAVPLDAVVEHLGFSSPDLIKIDVEGHEINALRGLRGTLEGSHPLLIVESNNWTARGRYEELLQYIRQCGYRLFMFMNDGSVTPFADDDVQHIVCADYLAVPMDRQKARALPHIRPPLPHAERLAMMQADVVQAGAPAIWHMRQVAQRIQDRYGSSPWLDHL